ncbi:MAG: nitroreductase family deazaflavin-dependent oxidoreductase [Acidimicrobiia bacterium]|nr:nitroreductase family deazaflavin-dependent oxidoreductase [Acidimicrobiia bacterium]
MSMSDHTEDSIKSFNETVIAEFRANGGKVAAFGNAPVVILNTIGAKSGQIRPTPLVALVDDSGMYVFASKAGAPTNPAWYHNLVANPEITVEHGTESFDALVEEMPEGEGQAKLAEQAALMPQFGEYIESAAPRVIPAFRISRR